ncbi:MAG: hypothetical protein M3P06_11540 [Acidobacteriota bacterium]|nr:hypothetical protein [Acidobacteriota bacterium]
MVEQILAVPSMTLIGGAAGLHMKTCSDHGFIDCPLLRASLNVVVAREADARQQLLVDALKAVRTLLRDNPDVRLEAQNYGDIAADSVFRKVDEALKSVEGEAGQ